MFLKAAINILFCLILVSTTIYAQTPLAEILENADLQRQNYEETFKNIFAQERKTFQGFKQDGTLKKSYQVEANFLVYQSNKNAAIITEYRNVTKFDGKNVSQNDDSENFFNNLLQAKSANDELTKIKLKSSKYDRDLMVSDLTLRQTPVLAKHIRPYFDFELIGTEEDKYLISYQQIKKSPFVLVNDFESNETRLTMDFGVALPSPIHETNARVRGKLWIDTKTFQIWREERELTIQPDNLQNPLVVFQINFEFAKENLEILVPKEITLISYLLKLNKKELIAVKDAQLNFEYSEYSKLNVNVKSSGILEPIVVERKH